MKKILTGFVSFLFFPTVVRASGIVINEFLPNPSSENSEWVEFYNSDSSSIDLSDYYFDDDTNFSSDSGSSTKIALSGLLPSLSTCYSNLSTFLNNNGDVPTLFKTDGSIIDTYQYTQTTAGKSYSRIPDGGDWQINQDPTKSSILCADLAPTPTPTPIPPTATPTPQPTSTPSPTNAPSATPPPTGGPTATRAPTTIPTSKPTVTPKATPTKDDVLGESAIEAENPTESFPEPTSSLKSTPGTSSSENSRSFIPLLFIITGSVLIIGSCSPFIVQYIRLRFKRGHPPV